MGRTHMTMMIKPIETRYKGYRFRSRLEARWAIFLDAIGINYRYEYDSYCLDGICYLPDFKLCPKWCGIGWIEIKPGWPTIKECDKAIRLCLGMKKLVCFLIDDVWWDAHSALIYIPLYPPKVEELLGIFEPIQDMLHWR